MFEQKAHMFQKWFSHLIDVRIETVFSDVNAYLEIVLSKGKYQLNSVNATYSYEDLYSSYAGALKKIGLQKEKINSVLVLGLGLGSIPYILQKKYDFECTIDCVEIDPLIISLAKKYYPSSEGFNKLLIHHADAYDWIQLNQKKFDLIAVDLFIDRNVPYQLHKKEFIQGIKNAVQYDGQLLFSRLKSNKNTESDLWDNLYSVFPNAEDIETMGNSILHWENK